MRGLPEATARLFEAIKPLENIGDFLLVGGSALALRLHHRMSADLDFMTTGKLNGPVIHGILGQLRDRGYKVTRIIDPIAHLGFEIEGFDIADYAMDWRVGGVKLSFFAKRLESAKAQRELESRLIADGLPGVDTGHIKVASEASVFALKAQVLCERVTSRDLFDLKTLIATGRYDMSALLREAEALGGNVDLVKERLVHGRLRTDDPPVNTMNGEPCDVGALRAWFVQQVNAYERDQAMRLYRERFDSAPR